ncbi:uncharacterized protein LOC124421305 isoform X2 [Lucilia cuprina]|uniref:uncharacterized protein LOC124421305 isoform X2 n=1 Tax=Lucilia cuprina TaxID=7375 RepID=UPI001F05443D|nr:uncharacterized protein LOC124421305 isoform X2 [Lucilia cuprina]
MASSESNTFEEESTPATITTTTTAENMPIESTPTQIPNELEMETEKEVNLSQAIVTPRSASYRAVRLSESDLNDEQQNDADSWWSEVENNDLLLDQVPNVTSVFTPSPEAILEKSISLAESESLLKGEENFDRLHRIADKIKMTLSEHAKNKEIEEKAERERKLSETSDREHKNGSLDMVGDLEVCKEQTLEEFKEELRTKRLQRQNAVQDLRDEIASLRRQLDLEREVNKRLRRGEYIEETSSTPNTDSVDLAGACAVEVSSISQDEDSLRRSRHANIELANAQLALQMANSENISLRGELAVVQKQVITLKEVIACCKQMLAVKEEQCNELI